MPDMIAFGKWVQEQRGSISRREFSKRCGLNKNSTSTLIRIEEGSRTRLEDETLHKLARGTGIPYETVANMYYYNAITRPKGGVAEAMEEVGSLIHTARVNSGKQLSEIAQEINMQPDRIIDMEEGRYIPDAIVMRQLSRVLGTSISALYGELEEGIDGQREGMTLQKVHDAVRDNHHILTQLYRIITDKPFENGRMAKP